MEQKELKIDLASVATEALKQRQPGEDLDEALLRSCKKLYGEAGATVFQGVRSALSAIASKKNVDQETALQQVMSGHASASIVTRTQTVITQKGSSSLDELPPEMRAEVEKTLASGKSGEVVLATKVSTGKEALSTLLGSAPSASANLCRYCGYEFSSDLPSCPQCGKPKKLSFWSRLFGK